jgi:hypothetical protein
MFIRILFGLIILISNLDLYAQLPIAHCPEDLVPKYDKQKKLWGYANLFGQWVIEPSYTKVSPFSEDKAVVQKGLSFGVIACDGQVILPNTFQSLTSYRDGKIWAQKNNLWGVLDHKGKILLDFQYEEINPIKSTQLTWVKKQENWGLFNEEKGRLIVQAQFSMATIMSPNASLVKVGEKMGVINHVNGGYLIKPEITRVKKIAKNIIVFKQNEHWGLFNKYGILRLNPEFDSLFVKFPETVVGIKNRQWGLYDLIGKEILAPEYNQFGELSEGLFSISKNEKFGFATRQGKIVIPMLYDEVQGFNHRLAIVKKGNESGIVDISHKIILPFDKQTIQRHAFTGSYILKKQLQKIVLFNQDLSKKNITSIDSIFASDSDSLVRARLENKIFFINIYTGSPINKDTYIYASQFYNGLAITRNKMYGAIDKSGKSIIAQAYDSLYPQQWNNKIVWVAKQNQNIGILDSTGKIMIPIQYQQVEYLGKGILKVHQNQKYQLIKTNQSVLSEETFDNIVSNQNNDSEWPLMVCNKNKWGLLNERGNLIVATNFDSITRYEPQLYVMKKGNSFTIADNWGKAIHETAFQEIQKPKFQTLIVKKGKKYGLLSTQGKEILKCNYDEIEYTNFSNLYLTREKKTWSVIDKSGIKKTNIDFDSYEIIGEQVFLIKNEKRFLLDKNGMVILKS